MRLDQDRVGIFVGEDGRQLNGVVQGDVYDVDHGKDDGGGAPEPPVVWRHLVEGEECKHKRRRYQKRRSVYENLIPWAAEKSDDLEDLEDGVAGGGDEGDQRRLESHSIYRFIHFAFSLIFNLFFSHFKHMNYIKLLPHLLSGCPRIAAPPERVAVPAVGRGRVRDLLRGDLRLGRGMPTAKTAPCGTLRAG